MFVLALMELVIDDVGALDLDPVRFRAFYEDALPRIYGYLLHRCGGSVPVAEDLTQETFLAVVGELKKRRRVETPMPWVYGIARHKLLDHYRRQELHERPIVGDVESEIDVPLDTESVVRGRVVEALADVAASQRAALVLFYLDGFSVPEVATELGKTVPAANSLLERGRANFKRAYLEACR